LFVNWGLTFQTILNFDMDPSHTVAYGADQTYGIVKFTNNSGTWVQAPYYFSTTNIGSTAQTSANQGCFGICVDFSGTNPVIYATTMENGYPTPNSAAGHQNQNRLIKIVDTGVNPGTNLVAQTLATASTTNEFFGGVDFTPDLSPLITSAPANYSTTNGGSAPFAVTVQSVYAVGYQWLQNGTNLNGATSSELTLNNLDTSFNNYLYQCVVTNNYGAVTSAVATLTVTVNPVVPQITSGTSSVINYVGNAETFAAVKATGTEPFTSYQWFNQSGPLSDGAKYSGSTSPSLIISNLTTSDSGNYYVAVANVAGSSTTNLVDVLTVGYHPATINAGQPASVTTFTNVPALLTADQTGGTPPLTYQWYRGTTALTDGTEFTGTATPTLTIAATTTSDSGTNYNIVISNPGGSVTSSFATVTVLVTPPLSSVLYSNQLYIQNFDSLPDPGTVSINSFNDPQDPGSINGVAYSLANPFDFNYPIVNNSFVGGLGLSKMQGWYGAADAPGTTYSGSAVDGITRFGLQDGDQSTGGVIDFGLNDVTGEVVGTNRALGLMSTSTTGATAFGLKLVNNSATALNYLDLSFIGELWRNNTGSRTISVGYILTNDTFALASDSISNSTLLGTMAFNFPTNPLGTLAVDGTQPSNQVVQVTNNVPLSSPWQPGQDLWVIWSINYYGTGAGQGYAIDNLNVSGTTITTTSPTAATTAATKVTATTAQLNSTINPNNGPTAYWFQYGPTASYGSNTPTSLVGVVSGSSSANSVVSGLTQLGTYHYRVVASNSAGTALGSDMTLTTLTNPVVATLTASNVFVGTTTLDGSVNPNNSAATYWFAYGTSTKYGSFSSTNNLASGSTAVIVTNLISGLSQGTTYHYQIVASTAAGTVSGSDKTFATPTVTAPQLRSVNLSGGGLSFSFTNAPGASFSVLGTNVLTAPRSAWPLVGHAVESPVGSGNYQFTDSAPTNSALFYILRQP
jgi:hypothetical protein